MPTRSEPEIAQRLIPPNPTVDALADAARACTACDLYRDATQVVFGDGPARADVLFVGEQPAEGGPRR